MVADLFAAVFNDCEKNGIYLADWIREPDMPYVVVPQFKEPGRENHPKALRADSLAKIFHENKDLIFYIEAENRGVKKRTKFNQSSFWKKIFYYQAVQNSGKFSRFRVLTVIKTKPHQDKLREHCRKADPAGKGLNTFWFVQQSDLQASSSKSVLFDPIWSTPSQENIPLLPK
jgi:hypothetical protein